MFRGPSSFISTYNEAVVEGFIRHALGSYGWDQEPLGMMENGARNGNTCPPSPSRSPLFLAPIVHQISGIPMYEPTPILRGYQLLLPIFLSRGKERSEKNGENAMRAGTTITLLPWLIGTKHIPEFKNSSQNPKHFPESKTHLRIQKHVPESKDVLDSEKYFGFLDVFLLRVFGFWEMLSDWNSGMFFVPTSNPTLHL